MDDTEKLTRDICINVGRIKGLRDAAKWCCLNGYDRKFPEVEEIRQKILAAADAIESEERGGHDKAGR